jgi:phosphotriesterase-related protein
MNMRNPLNQLCAVGAIILSIHSGHAAELEGSIMTVRGPIPAAELAKTLSHEHVLVDFIGAEESGYHRWDREEVISVMLPRLMAVKDLGYQSLFECTPAFLGRDPRLLRRLSELSELNLITNTGYYGARQNQFIPAKIQDWPINELVDKWIQEFEMGIEDTGIRPGFLKIGVDREDKLSAMHEKLIRAVCRVHLATGLTIASHTGPSPVVFQITQILKEEGVDPSAFIWVHATRDNSENQIRAARMGLWVSIDNLRENANLLRANVERIVALKEAGFLNRVLVSQDAGWYRPGEENGGAIAPFTFVEQSLVPALIKAGFEDHEVDQLLVQNPAHAYSIRVRRLPR